MQPVIPGCILQASASSAELLQIIYWSSFVLQSQVQAIKCVIKLLAPQKSPLVFVFYKKLKLDFYRSGELQHQTPDKIYFVIRIQVGGAVLGQRLGMSVLGKRL